mgnify:CR=1 FL=1
MLCTKKKCWINRVNNKIILWEARFSPAFRWLSGELPVLSLLSLQSTSKPCSRFALQTRAFPLRLTSKPLNHRLSPSNHSPYQPSPADCLTMQIPAKTFPLSHSTTCRPSATHLTLFFMLALPRSTQASTLRLFSAVRFLFLFFWGGRDGYQQVSSNVDCLKRKLTATGFLPNIATGSSCL